MKPIFDYSYIHTPTQKTDLTSPQKTKKYANFYNNEQALREIIELFHSPQNLDILFLISSKVIKLPTHEPLKMKASINSARSPLDRRAHTTPH